MTEVVITKCIIRACVQRQECYAEAVGEEMLCTGSKEGEDDVRD